MGQLIWEIILGLGARAFFKTSLNSKKTAYRKIVGLLLVKRSGFNLITHWEMGEASDFPDRLLEML